MEDHSETKPMARLTQSAVLCNMCYSKGNALRNRQMAEDAMRRRLETSDSLRAKRARDNGDGAEGSNRLPGRKGRRLGQSPPRAMTDASVDVAATDRPPD